MVCSDKNYELRQDVLHVSAATQLPNTMLMATRGRSRKKKCDERTPACDRCSLSSRSCKWPDSVDLVDRRYTAHPKSRYGNIPEAMICLHSERATCDQVIFNLEAFIARHFFEKFFNLLFLPGGHPDFHNGWIEEIQELMVGETSLHCSVLMNGASHIYNSSNLPEMKHLALDYYSRALRSLASTLARPRTSQLKKRNAILSSIMLLYLHGVSISFNCSLYFRSYTCSALGRVRLPMLSPTSSQQQIFWNCAYPMHHLRVVGLLTA